MLITLKEKLENEYNAHFEAIDEKGNLQEQCDLFRYTGLLLDARTSTLERLVSGGHHLNGATTAVKSYLEYVDGHEPTYNGDVSTRLELLRKVITKLDSSYASVS